MNASAIIPIHAAMPRISDDEMAQAVFRAAERRQKKEIDQALRAFKARSSHAQRMLRMPDGTHMAYRIPQIAYHYWGRRLGYECWKDDQFVHEFLRDNPGCRVHSEAVNPTILTGWAPSSPLAKMYRKEVGGSAMQAGGAR